MLGLREQELLLLLLHQTLPVIQQSQNYLHGQMKQPWEWTEVLSTINFLLSNRKVLFLNLGFYTFFLLPISDKLLLFIYACELEHRLLIFNQARSLQPVCHIKINCKKYHSKGTTRKLAPCSPCNFFNSEHQAECYKYLLQSLFYDLTRKLNSDLHTAKWML